MIYCTGIIYEGQWYEGKHHGFGKLKHLTFEDISQVGIFKNNKFIKDTSINLETVKSGAHGLSFPASPNLFNQPFKEIQDSKFRLHK